MNLVIVFTILLTWSAAGVYPEVVPRFEGTLCSKYFYQNTEPRMVKESGFRRICQMSRMDTSRSFFVTLYDTLRKIPVYAAYTLDIGTRRRRPRNWNIEPQLECRTRSKYTTKSRMNSKLRNQARNDDYKNYTKPGSGKFDRGHLNPKGYQSGIGQTVTFTLTNVVPQYKKFNQGSWRLAEEAAYKVMAEHCFGNADTRRRPYSKVNSNAQAYFITGAIPGEAAIGKSKDVNVPKITFTAACCFDPTRGSKFSFGFYGNNIAEPRDQHTQAVDIIELQHKINDEWPSDQNIQLFVGDCNANGSEYYLNAMKEKL